MATAEVIPRERRFLLRGVGWRTYVSLREAPENYQVRMTYHRGDLEIMSPSKSHELFAALLGRFIDAWTEELDIDIQSCRTVTFSREDLECGLEPDNCYYVQNEPLVRNKTELDLAADPPPDLAVEVELTRKAVCKMPLYAAFGVPEVWRYDGLNLQVFQRDPQGEYVERDTSRVLPEFPLDEVERLLGLVAKDRETALVRSFRNWVRQHIEAARRDQGSAN